jgi:hypothetical protein
MESSDWPSSPEPADALVVRVIDDIDESNDEVRNTLLCDLMCAAPGCASPRGPLPSWP